MKYWRTKWWFYTFFFNWTYHNTHTLVDPSSIIWRKKVAHVQHTGVRCNASFFVIINTIEEEVWPWSPPPPLFLQLPLLSPLWVLTFSSDSVVFYIILTGSLFYALQGCRTCRRPRKCLGPCCAPSLYPGNAFNKMMEIPGACRGAGRGRVWKPSEPTTDDAILSQITKVHVVLLGCQVWLSMACESWLWSKSSN